MVIVSARVRMSQHTRGGESTTAILRDLFARLPEGHTIALEPDHKGTVDSAYRVARSVLSGMPESTIEVHIRRPYLMVTAGPADSDYLTQYARELEIARHRGELR